MPIQGAVAVIVINLNVATVTIFRTRFTSYVRHGSICDREHRSACISRSVPISRIVIIKGIAMAFVAVERPTTAYRPKLAG